MAVSGMGVIDRLDRFQRRHRWLGFPLAVSLLREQRRWGDARVAGR